MGVKVSDGYRKGLNCGANVIMPNMGRNEYRDLYAIYPGKGEGLENMGNQLEVIKYFIVQEGRSVVDHYGNRNR